MPGGGIDRRALLQRTRRSPLRPSRSEERARATATGRAGRETTKMSARVNMAGLIADRCRLCKKVLRAFCSLPCKQLACNVLS